MNSVSYKCKGQRSHVRRLRVLSISIGSARQELTSQSKMTAMDV